MDETLEPIAEQAAEEEPKVDVITFDPPIEVSPKGPGAPLETVASVEYRGNDGNHIVQLPDGRVVAVPAVSEDRASDIRIGLS